MWKFTLIILLLKVLDLFLIFLESKLTVEWYNVHLHENFTGKFMQQDILHNLLYLII